MTGSEVTGNTGEESQGESQQGQEDEGMITGSEGQRSSGQSRSRCVTCLRGGGCLWGIFEEAGSTSTLGEPTNRSSA